MEISKILIKTLKNKKTLTIPNALISDNVLFVTDGVTLFKLKDKTLLDAEHLTVLSDEDKEDYIKSYKSYIENIASDKINLQLITPTQTELKEIIKQGKLTRKNTHQPIVYDFGENKPNVNAEYLLNILKALNVKDRIMCYTCESRPTLSPVYFFNDEITAILCPLRK